MNTPIVDFVNNYAQSNALRLHMPGHKGNGILGCEKYDITEINGADVLYSAKGIIAESQKNAADLFGTRATFYSTEGSSLCIRAMLYLTKLYALQNGKKPIVAAGRNAHKTFVTGAALLDIDVDWLLPDNNQTVISCVVTADYLDNYLRNVDEKPVAVYITSPDYLGAITDIKSLSDVCRKHGVLLLVDNAHGAYLKFLQNDIHPITQGADMCCDSAHKTLPVLTGGAYLHIGKNAPELFESDAQKALGMFASTSPSYLILGSLDAANRYITDVYCKNLPDILNRVKFLKEDLVKCGYTLYGNEPLKITLSTKAYGYTGYEISDILLNQKIVCEFADPDFIVFMFTPQLSGENLEQLKTALCNIKKKKAINILPVLPSIKKTTVSMQETLFAPQEKLKISKCLGRVSASLEVACPPAIPIVLPGEKIDEETIASFKYYNINEWTVVK